MHKILSTYLITGTLIFGSIGQTSFAGDPVDVSGMLGGSASSGQGNPLDISSELATLNANLAGNEAALNGVSHNISLLQSGGIPLTMGITDLALTGGAAGLGIMAAQLGVALVKVTAKKVQKFYRDDVKKLPRPKQMALRDESLQNIDKILEVGMTLKKQIDRLLSKSDGDSGQDPKAVYKRVKEEIREKRIRLKELERGLEFGSPSNLSSQSFDPEAMGSLPPQSSPSPRDLRDVVSMASHGLSRVSSTGDCPTCELVDIEEEVRELEQQRKQLEKFFQKQQKYKNKLAAKIGKSNPSTCEALEVMVPAYENLQDQLLQQQVLFTSVKKESRREQKVRMKRVVKGAVKISELGAKGLARNAKRLGSAIYGAQDEIDFAKEQKGRNRVSKFMHKHNPFRGLKRKLGFGKKSEIVEDEVDALRYQADQNAQEEEESYTHDDTMNAILPAAARSAKYSDDEDHGRSMAELPELDFEKISADCPDIAQAAVRTATQARQRQTVKAEKKAKGLGHRFSLLLQGHTTEESYQQSRISRTQKEKKLYRNALSQALFPANKRGRVRRLESKAALAAELEEATKHDLVPFTRSPQNESFFGSEALDAPKRFLDYIEKKYYRSFRSVEDLKKFVTYKLLGKEPKKGKFRTNQDAIFKYASDAQQISQRLDKFLPANGELFAGPTFNEFGNFKQKLIGRPLRGVRYGRKEAIVDALIQAAQDNNPGTLLEELRKFLPKTFANQEENVEEGEESPVVASPSLVDSARHSLPLPVVSAGEANVDEDIEATPARRAVGPQRINPLMDQIYKATKKILIGTRPRFGTFRKSRWDFRNGQLERYFQESFQYTAPLETASGSFSNRAVRSMESSIDGSSSLRGSGSSSLRGSGSSPSSAPRRRGQSVHFQDDGNPGRCSTSDASFPFC